MGRITLQLKADLENIASLVPQQDYEYHFKFRCGSCNEIGDNWVTVNAQDTSATAGKGNRSSFNLVMRCKFCKREGVANIEDKSVTPYTDDHNGQFAPLVTLECRGIEPVEWEPRSGFTAIASGSDTRFDDVDLTEKEWADYDEKGAQAVGITEVESRFAKAS